MPTSTITTDLPVLWQQIKVVQAPHPALGNQQNLCFTVHENPEKLITSNVVVSCVRCYSSSHVNCIGSHPNSPLLVLGDSNGGKTVDKNAAKIFLAACKISAGSMNKTAVTGKMEMEARAKEAIDARELALKAIEHVEHLRRNSAST
ncbi:uncharacterized protein LOC141660054 [Apium graveolens]|uniref:uncharacterized protein LOC141660054 n=1 Tax=Apium graveolens TaxID=4045 RepID=UPI003D7A8C9C